MPDFKPILCVDFDGVIHSYERGWQGGEIYGTITPGFFEWLEVVCQKFKVMVYSSRSQDEAMRDAMMHWFVRHYETWRSANGQTELIEDAPFGFATQKPAAWLTIDDRTIQFHGDWHAPELSADAMLAFRPWNARKESK